MMEPIYIEPKDPMWDEHERTVSERCTCDYSKMQNGLWKTLAIRRDVDVRCPEHGKS